MLARSVQRDLVARHNSIEAELQRIAWCGQHVRGAVLRRLSELRASAGPADLLGRLPEGRAGPQAVLTAAQILRRFSPPGRSAVPRRKTPQENALAEWIAKGPAA